MEYVSRHATDPASAPTTLRLLPWPSPGGKPGYLVTDSRGGPVSRLADEMEATQLAMGVDVLDLARAVLDDPASPYTEVRYAGIRLAECLTDALRVAESRGLRLPSPDADDAEDAEDAHDVVQAEDTEHTHDVVQAEVTERILPT
ncbi:hypothetical protein M2271_008307 [Streptomyces sp. LBL]|uniref:hypothetical protein n=1 Tax=Streptomyces sp. LBL TaxID=2940562 RepID=UPI0024757294|nr:hypothetical protein [Streptomyces sp. LBL]MDH6630447.1 hypothetical protein [Streptomyces sp. LBL]